MTTLRKHLLVLLLCTCTSVAVAQFPPGPNSTRPQHIFESQLFIADPVVFYNKKDSPSRLDVYIKIPYRGIQFAKDTESKESGDIYSANVQYEIVLKSSFNDSVIVNELKDVKISEKYNTKLLRAGSKIIINNYNLSPGKYLLNITVSDVNTQKKYSENYNIDVLEGSGKDIYTSDIMILSSYEKNSEGKTSITPLISNDVGRSKNYFVFFEVYNNSAEAITKELNFSFKNNNDKVLSVKKQSYSFQPGTNAIVEKFSSVLVEEENLVLEVSDSSGKVLTKKYLLNRPVFREPDTRIFPPQF